MTAAGVPTPTDPREPKHGDAVSIDGRPAVFLYRRGHAAVVRFDQTGDSRVVPFTKIEPRVSG